MRTLSSTHQAVDRSLELVSHLAGAAAALARQSIRRARTDNALRGLCDEQRDDTGLDRPVCRPQSAIDARLMSELMSMR